MNDNIIKNSDVREQIQAAEQLRASGWSTGRIAGVLRVDRRTVQRWFAVNKAAASEVKRQFSDFTDHCQKLA